MIAIERWLRFVYEGFGLYLLFIAAFYFWADQWPPIFAFILLWFLSSAAIYLFFRNKQKKSYAAMMAFMPFTAALAWLLGFPIILAVALGALGCWRAFLHFFRFRTSSDAPPAFGLFFCALVLALGLYMFHAYTYRQDLLVLLLLQFFFLLFMKGFERMNTLPSGNQASHKTYLRWGIGTFAAFVGAAVVLLALNPVMKWLYFTGFSLLAHGIGYIIGYPLYWLLSPLVSKENGKDLKNDLLTGDEQHQDPPQQASHDSGTALPYGWIFLGIAIIAFVIVLIMVYRKRMTLSQEDHEAAGDGDVSLRLFHRGTKAKKERGRPPKNTVRRRFYQMQRVLASRGFRRQMSESVEDWFARLDFPAGDKDTVAAAYQKVRYGEAELSPDESHQFEAAIDALIRRAKENKKQKH